MKKTTSFRFSDETLEQLDSLAKLFNKSKTEVLEFLIADRYSASDQNANAIRRKKTWLEWEGRLDRLGPTKEDCWMNGYNTGWVHFQTRHKDNDFIIPI